MFANLIFLSLVRVLISFAPTGIEAQWLENFWPKPSGSAFLTSIGLYFALLFLIYLQNLLFSRRFWQNKGAILTLVNIELIFFLMTSLFLLGAQRVFGG